MRAVILIRILVGWVFISEGIQKFLFPAALGVGRFAKIGIPHPGVMAPLVGAIEIVCGAMVILGLLTRLATIPLLAVIVTAIVTTKVPILHQQGVWAMLHEARVDFSMALGLLFLLFVGAGAFAMTGSRERMSELDAAVAKRRGGFEEFRAGSGGARD
jgi:putative oxidoreductase